METSDSDYFESADEEFYTDDDVQYHTRSGKTRCNAMPNITEKVKHLNISDDAHTQRKADTLDVQQSKDYQRQLSSDSDDEHATLKATKEQYNGNKETKREPTTDSHNKMNDIWDNNDWDDVKTTSTGKQSTKSTTGGAIVETKTSKAEADDRNEWDDDDDDWNEIEIMIKNESKSATKKAEGVRVANLPRANVNVTKKQSDYEGPSDIVGCWEAGVNSVNNFVKEVPKLPSSDNQARDEPEFSEIQETVGSWETNVNADSSEKKPFFGTIGDAKKMERRQFPQGDCWEENASADKHVEEKEENMWEDDEWEPLEETQVAIKENSTWSSWGNWGISSVISTATTLTSHVSQGLANALESGIGAPDPEELARMNKLETQSDEPEESKSSKAFDLGNFVQGVTKLVETTGNKVLTGGLDTLETIGKKTMEVLQENDPGFKRKRAFLKIDDDKPILSKVLREAKEKAEKDNRQLEERQTARRANYETLFDDHQGLVHLEALEMLSKQCDIKLENFLQTTSGDELTDVRETLNQVKELSELPDEDENESPTGSELEKKLNDAVSELNVDITYDRLIKLWCEVESSVSASVCGERDLHQRAIETLAQLTAISVEQFHKCAELLLVKEHRITADEVDSLVQLTTTLTALIGNAAAKFSERLNVISANSDNKEDVNGLITNIFLEAANSSSYIQDAFQLLIPVLQVGAV